MCLSLPSLVLNRSNEQIKEDTPKPPNFAYGFGLGSSLGVLLAMITYILRGECEDNKPYGTVCCGSKKEQSRPTSLTGKEA